MILLDTHTWVWWVSQRLDLLPRNVNQRISTAEEPVTIASVSCLEVALLVKKGRLALSDDLSTWFQFATEGSGVELLPLTPNIAAKTVVLPDIHRDPIDRVLIATAIEYDAVFLTKDAAIQSYPVVRTIWDRA